MSDGTALRILLIAHGLPPESVGGVEQHVDGLARALVEAGHDVHVWCRTGRAGAAQGATFEDPPDETAYRVTRFVYRYEGLSNLRSLYSVPALDDALAGFLEGNPPFDVAHVHHLTGVSTGTVDVLHAHGVPVVLTAHDYWLICPRGQMWHREGHRCDVVDPAACAACLRPRFGGWVAPGADGEAVLRLLHVGARTLLEAVDALIAPSARAIPPFADLGIDPTRFRVVENGVDVTALGRLPPADPAPDAPLRVGYLGTLIPSKGLHVLVDAMLALPKGLAELHVHGNAVPYHGDDSYLTRVFARVSPDDRVTYHGPYHTDRLPEILAAIDVVAAPALWREAFGLTVREALAAGRPVLVSRIGGLQDAVADGVAGRVLAPGDVADWTSALRELAMNRARVREMARAAREAVPVRGFAAMADELLTVYRGLAERDAAGGSRVRT